MATPTSSTSSTAALATTPKTGGTATPIDTLNADTTLGTTKVDNAVVAKIAGIAAREVPGVHDLGGGAARALGALRNRVGQQDHAQGISVEVGETQVAADVSLTADYPVPLQQVADGVRAAVIDAVENLVGLQVTEVNVTITDVVIPGVDDADDDQPSRVQ